MTRLTIVRGSAADYPLQCTLRGGKSPASFAAGDTLTCWVSGGSAQLPAITPAASWYTAGGTQTGYDQGQVLVAVAAAQSGTLEPAGSYLLEVWWTAADASRTACVWRGTLAVEPSAGSATPAVRPYCTLADVLEVAPWVRLVQDADTDLEGFSGQRLQARQWMDQAILNCYRGAFVGLFETHSTAAFAFGYAGWRRSLGPSPSLESYLKQDMLLVKPYIVRACAHWAASLIGLAQIGVNPQQAQYGCYHRDEAEREMTAITAEIDLNGDSIGELFVSLGSTNSLFT